MPWADIIIILMIVVAAIIGYAIGFIGALKGFISSLVAMIAAWVIAPIVQAWLETKWGVETFLAEMIASRLPAPLHDAIQGIAQGARTLQEFRQNLYSAPLPPGMAQYLQGMMSKAPDGAPFSPDLAVSYVAGSIATYLLYTFLYILIWLILSILIKGFLSMVFVGKDGKTLLGIFDGALGAVALTLIVFACMTVFSGAMYPVMLMSESLMTESGNVLARFYPYLLESRLISWMAGFYQMRIIPFIT